MLADIGGNPLIEQNPLKQKILENSYKCIA